MALSNEQLGSLAAGWLAADCHCWARCHTDSLRASIETKCARPTRHSQRARTRTRTRTRIDAHTNTKVQGRRPQGPAEGQSRQAGDGRRQRPVQANTAWLAGPLGSHDAAATSLPLRAHKPLLPIDPSPPSPQFPPLLAPPCSRGCTLSTAVRNSGASRPLAWAARRRE